MQYETEEQQVEAMKEWWAENGKAVITGIVLGALLVGAWLWWKGSQERKAVAASDNYSQTVEALESGDTDKIAELSSAAKEDHDGTLYAAYTSLAAARAAVENGDLDTAAKELEWAANNAELEEVGTVASVRLARVKAAQGDSAAGLAALPKTYSDVFAALIEEVRGDLYVLAEDNAAAKAAYQLAIDSGKATDPGALQIKFNELASVGSGS